MCSYFTHFYDNPQQEAAQRARQIRYYRECVIPALPGDPKTAPPSYTYFIDMVKRYIKCSRSSSPRIRCCLAIHSRSPHLEKSSGGFSESSSTQRRMKPHQMSRTR